MTEKAVEVLVVDDNGEILALVRAILELKGFVVRTARDGVSALTAVEQQLPDVILLDVMMPDMDGKEVLARLKASSRTASIPVILLTARAQDEDLLAGYELGADYYITKPFTKAQILYGIDLVLGSAREKLQPPYTSEKRRPGPLFPR